MAYGRLDDRYDDHRKIKKAWKVEPAVVGFHAMAIAYANRHATDGVLDREWVEEKLDALPYRSCRKRAVMELLLGLKLFEKIDSEHFRVHDFLDWNLSAATRKKLSEQGKKGGRPRGKESQPESQGFSLPGKTGLSPIKEVNKEKKTSSPSPSRTDPTVVSLCERLAGHVKRNDPKAKPNPRSDAWLRDMRLLLNDRHGAVIEIREVMDWALADGFWSSNVLSPGKLRKHFTRLSMQMKRPDLRVVGQRENASDWLRAINGEDA